MSHPSPIRRTPRRAGSSKLIALLLMTSGAGMGITTEGGSNANMPPAKGCTSPAPRADRPSERPQPGAADFVVSVNGNLQWVVNGAVNPTLTLTRGQTYLFDLTAFQDEHPFVINADPIFPFAPLLLPDSYGAIVPFTPSIAMPATIYYHCTVHYGPMKGTINLVSPPCIGDLNTDGSVNSFDFGLFASAFGGTCTGCRADMNGDNAINSFDFGIFASAFGSPCN